MSAVDTQVVYEKHRADPVENAAAVTPSDSVDLTAVSEAIWIGTLGDLKVITKGGQTVTFSSASGWMPVRASRVLATGTTASSIVAVW